MSLIITYHFCECSTELFGINGHFSNFPKLKFPTKKVQSNGFPGITDKTAIPTDPLFTKTSVMAVDCTEYEFRSTN